MSQYPPRDSDASLNKPSQTPGARISAIEEGSPADDVGFSPGCIITHVDGEPLRDIIDWRWLSAGEEITVGYIDLDGDEGEVELWREPGEFWGFEFDGLVFDGVKQCRNNCTFCFMHQLPRGMRRSLYLRDDDFRLSFLVGTFVTLTNLTPEDEQRIIDQRITPLRMSLQVTNPEVRKRLIGRHAQHGIDALERLLAAGIEFHAQIVLVPEENDGAILKETLEWAYKRPGILNIGIVPLGYTSHQSRFDHSFNDPKAAKAVLDLIAPFQKQAQQERNTPWVFAADEFYRNAYRNTLLENIPDTTHYGDFSLFEDGIGIIRSTIDDWQKAEESNLITKCEKAAITSNTVVRLIAGEAQKEFLTSLIERSKISHWFQPLYVKNNYFGGNVDVTGLLTAQDIIGACKSLTKQQISVADTICNTQTKQMSAEGAICNTQAKQLLAGDAICNTQTTKLLSAGDGACERFRSQENLQPTTSRRARTSEQAPSPADKSGGKSNHLLPEINESGIPNQPDSPDCESKVSNRPPTRLIVIPKVIFNDNNLTLDDYTIDDMKKETAQELHMVSCSPLQYFPEITELINAEG